jgi:tetratricopeptide (TPR) repeat protein
LLEQALNLSPTNPKFQRKLASTLSQKGYQLYNKDDFLGAIELFKKSVEYEPNNPEYFRNLGWSYLELGTRKKNRGESYESYFKDAESAHQKAVQIDPDFAGAYYGLGYVYVRQNKINDAIINFRKAISTQPDSEWASKSQKVLKSLGVD